MGALSSAGPDADVSIAHEAEIIEVVVRRADGAVHLVGHSYGGQACLAVAMRGLAPLTSLSVIEPTATSVLPLAGDMRLYDEVTTFRDAYFRAFESGDKEAARHVIDLHDGAGSFDVLPSRVRDYVMATTATNILDWRSGLGMDAPLSAYSAIAVPTLVIRGGSGHPYIARSAEILSNALPHASLVTISGAAHSMIATHAAEVAKLIADHLSKAEMPA